MLDEKLLRILCCPKCGGLLERKPEIDTLTCTHCGKEYPVQNDIPILLVDDER